MPVTVQCFHCSAILDLDDGFRGGVCRCSNCGSLLQVPPGETAPRARKVRPAMPPSPTSPTTPTQNATSSKLDVGMSRGQFDMPSSSTLRTGDRDISSGLASRHIVPTTPVAEPEKRQRRTRAEAAQAAPPPAAAPTEASPPATRGRALQWLAVTLIVLTLAAIASMVIYYRFFYEP